MYKLFRPGSGRHLEIKMAAISILTSKTRRLRNNEAAFLPPEIYEMPHICEENNKDTIRLTCCQYSVESTGDVTDDVINCNRTGAILNYVIRQEIRTFGE